ncbi:hypothetical protein FF36_03590 [Frankia torreyi]|uniref:Uncharacterized protein n=1 Tax=Frankia torreyi TaxID=1856 RepID=A0A0D8BCZ2_9ACTN|nr:MULTISPECIES: hypothetical protein [Frankia]KJE22158.1 hypothetical protein FF36_03590 [Frankia torreyi]KQM04234.1 hypothetical protein FF86_10287 [Frankia sp. CpI1-P]
MTVIPPRDEPPAAARVVGYVEVTDPGFRTHAEATFRQDRPSRGGLLLRGHCPRCGHYMTYYATDVVVRGLLPLRRPRPPTPAAGGDLTVICTCAEEHAGRPEDYEGCGAYWLHQAGPA